MSDLSRTRSAVRGDRRHRPGKHENKPACEAIISDIDPEKIKRMALSVDFEAALLKRINAIPIVDTLQMEGELDTEVVQDRVIS